MSQPIRVSGQDDRYLEQLRDLEDPPGLFVLGALHSRRDLVSIVGSRRCTRYGLDLAERFGRRVALAGWGVVSGLARGVDAAAHRGCLAESGYPIAVLGSGIDVCYPKENRPIYDQIISEGGAIVSEYPPGTPPDRWRFPARNRIIAALASVVVVVEASSTGGALITARLAAEIGRQVFAVPGDVDRDASEGCNQLLKDGAHPVLGPSDLIEELSLILGPPRNIEDGRTDAVPEAGATIDELSAMWSLPLRDTLARVGMLELEGEVKRAGDRVIPGR